MCVWRAVGGVIKSSETASKLEKQDVMRCSSAEHVKLRLRFVWDVGLASRQSASVKETRRRAEGESVRHGGGKEKRVGRSVSPRECC